MNKKKAVSTNPTPPRISGDVCYCPGQFTQMGHLLFLTRVVAKLAAWVLVNACALPVPRWHHQLQLHPPGAVSAALHTLPELFRHGPLLPGQLPDSERVAECGHHPHPAPGRGEPPGAHEADLLLPAGRPRKLTGLNCASRFLLQVFVAC